MRRHRWAAPVVTIVLVVALLSAAALLSACGRSTASTSSDSTAALFPGERPAEATWPPPPMKTNPRTAAYSYALWMSMAYRLLNSSVASTVVSPYQLVHVDSYVELNREQNRAIDQRILGWRVKSAETRADTATVAVREDWAYRYIDIRTGKWGSPPYTVSYDSTYTVVKDPTAGWVVTSVEATSVTGPVK